jgi:tetratricopeptide (TPR) repeat protein
MLFGTPIDTAARTIVMRMSRGLKALLRLALTCAGCVATPGLASGQAECATAACPLAVASTPALAGTWAAAARIHQHKLDFVAAIQAFARAQAGTFGDEGPQLVAAVDEMAAALSRWDTAVDRFRADSSRIGAVPDAHLARATVYLERLRLDDAIRELTAASRIDPERADIFALQGLAHAAAGRHAEAVRALRRAVSIAPDNPPLFYALARQSMLLDKPEDALAAYRSFTRAVSRQGPGRGEPQQRRFDRLGLLRQVEGVASLFPRARYAAGFEALRSGDYSTAIARLRDAALLDPLNTHHQEAKGTLSAAAAALRSGDLARAITLLGSVTDRGPARAGHHVPEMTRLLGVAYWLDEQTDASIAALEAALRSSPDDDRARLLLGELLAASGRSADAERTLLEAGAPGHPSGDALRAASHLQERRADLHGAIGSLKRADGASAIAGQDAFYASMGRILVNQAAFDEAVAAYGRRIDVNPNNAEAHRILGEVFFLQGRHEEALAEFTAATWIEPALAKAHAGIGHAHVRLEQFPEAVAAFRRALALDERATEARYALASTLLRLGQRSEASGELERVRREQNEAHARGQLAFKIDALTREAAAATAGGRHEAALSTLRHLLSNAPDDGPILHQLGVALLAAQRYEDAVALLERAQQQEATVEGAAALADAYALAGRADAAEVARARRDELVRQRKLRRVRELTSR